MGGPKARVKWNRRILGIQPLRRGVKQCKSFTGHPRNHLRARAEAPEDLLVFYHGGGWAIGDLDAYDALCRLTCRDAGIHVLSVDYRLAPEHPAPAAVEERHRRARGVARSPEVAGGPKLEDAAVVVSG